MGKCISEFITNAAKYFLPNWWEIGIKYLNSLLFLREKFDFPSNLIIYPNNTK